MRENIESVVCESNEQAIANIDKEMEEKQMELIRYANSTGVKGTGVKGTVLVTMLVTMNKVAVKI